MRPYPQEDLDHIKNHAPDFYGKGVFLTGATGWFGSWISSVLYKQRCGLIVHGRNVMLPGSLHFDYIIHCSPADTKQILDFAHQKKAKVLFVSSGAVYDREDEYADQKREDEKLCRSHPAKPVIARCFTFVGPGQKLEHWAASNFLQAAVEGRDLIVHGDGASVRSYMHMADLTVWLLTLLVRGIPRRAYDVGSERPINIADLAGKIAKFSGSKVIVEGKQGKRGQEHPYYVPSTMPAEDLGLQVRIGLDDSLKRTYDWMKANQNESQVLAK